MYLECASNTIQENWLLGFSYLFNLRHNRIPSIEKFFTNTSSNNLYSQTALYFYSLELYKKLNDNCDNLYLYDPLNMIDQIFHQVQLRPESDLKEAFVRWIDNKSIKAKVETEWTEDWGDFSYDDDDSEDTEDKRFKKFEIKFNVIENKEHYTELKGLLLKWPKFVDSKYTRIDNNPILRIMALVTTYITLDDYQFEYETHLLEEYRQFVTKLADEDVSVQIIIN